jgi:hypothetical protein
MLFNDPIQKKVMVATPGVKGSGPVDFNSELHMKADCKPPQANSVLSIPHSAAFLDLDGDCMPDLFLTKEVFDEAGNPTGYIYEIFNQVQTSENRQIYCLVQWDSIEAPMPMFEFADMDRDGMTDMVYYNEANSAIYTLYNRKTANKASDDSLCVKPLADGWKNLMGESNRIFSS